jgi:hypothetical protein
LIAVFPHSGQGNGSEIGASFRRDENIKNDRSFLRQKFTLRVDVETVEGHTFDHIELLDVL